MILQAVPPYISMILQAVPAYICMILQAVPAYIYFHVPGWVTATYNLDVNTPHIPLFNC